MSQPAANPVEHLSAQQCAPQWRGFLRALGGYTADELGPDDSAELFRALGRRMAGGLSLPTVSTLAELQDALNASWNNAQWGWVELAEQDDTLELAHYGAPLSPALGEDGPLATAALLAGYYEQLLTALGAGDSIELELLNSTATHVPVSRFRLRASGGDA